MFVLLEQFERRLNFALRTVLPAIERKKKKALSFRIIRFGN